MNREHFNHELYDLLPKALQDITAGFNGREKDIVLLSSIGVISSILPNVMGVYKGVVIYPNLYIIVLAPPASGKGVMNYSRKLVEPIHEKLYTESLKNKKKAIKEKKEDVEIPEIKIKIVPANISSSKLYEFLKNSDDGLLMIESEADTLGNMLKNDWGNFSDLLRKAFHHETVSISRKTDDLYFEKKNPKLSIVISGTPSQLKPIINSKDDGLFSRFAIYSFDDIPPFKDVFDESENLLKSVFQSYGDQFLKLYDTLLIRTEPIKFSFTKEQISNFYKIVPKYRDTIIEEGHLEFVSSVNRIGLIYFRIAMILSVIRNFKDVGIIDEIICSDEDYMAAGMISWYLINHSFYVYNTMDKKNISRIPLEDREIINALPKVFSRKTAIELGSKYKIPERTMDEKLSRWQNMGIVVKIKNGQYGKK